MDTATEFGAATAPMVWDAPLDGSQMTKRLPLYLLGGKARTVDLDGPALLLRQHGGGRIRYPFARLSRILASPQIHWTPRALSACLEARIPIVFLGKGQEPIGYLLPVQDNPSSLDKTLQEYLAQERWESSYRHWLRSERMRILRGWRTAMTARGHEISEAKYRELVHIYIYSDDNHASAGGNLYYSAITALVAERLVKAGVCARYWGIGGQALELAADIGGLLELVLRLEMHGLGDTVHGSDTAMMRILHAFGETLQDRCIGILGRLHRNLRERLEQWR